MQLMLYNTNDLTIEWLLWAHSDVFTSDEVMSALSRKADAQIRGQNVENGQQQTFIYVHAVATDPDPVGPSETGRTSVRKLEN